MKSIRYSFLLACFLVSAINLRAQSGKIADSLEDAGKYKEALVYYTKALKEKPGDEMFLRGRGFCEIETGDYDNGIKDYQAAFDIDPKCSRCLVHMGRAELMRKNVPKGMEYLNHAIQVSDTFADAYVFRANVEASENKIFDATNDYNKAVSLKPGEADYYIQRAGFKLSTGLTTAAFKDYDKAIELQPKNGKHNQLRAEAFQKQLNWDEALKDNAIAMRKGYKNAQTYSFRATVNDILHRYTDAKADYDTALRYDSLEVNIYLNRSSTLYNLEDMEGCCADCHKVLDLVKRKGAVIDAEAKNYIAEHINQVCDPAKLGYYCNNGIAAFNKGDYKKAVSFYDDGLKKFPVSHFLYSFKGNALLSLGRYNEAMAAYKVALSYKNSFQKEMDDLGRPATQDAERGDMASIYSCMAKCLSGNDNFTDALKLMDSMLLTKPAFPDMYKAALLGERAEILRLQKKYDAAISGFSDALAVYPASNIYFGRGLARFNMAMTTYNADASGVIYAYMRFSFQGNTMQQNTPVRINKPADNHELQNQPGWALALEDCDNAIALNSEYGEAYLLKGLLKYYGGKPDYCYDIYKARDLNVQEAKSLIIGDCK